MFKINTGYYLELLKPEIMNLPKSTENKITKDKNGKNVLYFQFTDVILVLTMDNNVSNGYQQDSRVFYTFVPNKLLGNLLEILPYYSTFYFSRHLIWRFFISKYRLQIEIVNR